MSSHIFKVLSETPELDRKGSAAEQKKPRPRLGLLLETSMIVNVADAQL